MDSIVLAHVADAITEIRDVDFDYSVEQDYDLVADDAANLLTRVPALAETVARWNAGEIGRDALVAEVRAALGTPVTRYTVYTWQDGRGHEVDAGADVIAAWDLADRMRAAGHASATVIEYANGAR